MPVVMKCQINNQKSQIFPNTKLDRLGKIDRYLQLRSFTFFALHDLYSGSCATSTLAPLRVAKLGWLGWLPRQAKLPLHVGWHRTRQICHWPLNVKSTMVATYNFAASPFLHYTISTQTILDHAGWRLPLLYRSGMKWAK